MRCLVERSSSSKGSVASDPNSKDVDVADAYMTLVGYFNSLRELGGVLRLLDDDVPARLRVLQRRQFGPNRFLYEKDRELTSRRSSVEIADTLEALDRTFKDKGCGILSDRRSPGVEHDLCGS